MLHGHKIAKLKSRSTENLSKSQINIFNHYKYTVMTAYLVEKATFQGLFVAQKQKKSPFGKIMCLFVHIHVFICSHTYVYYGLSLQGELFCSRGQLERLRSR